MIVPVNSVSLKSPNVTGVTKTYSLKKSLLQSLFGEKTLGTYKSSEVTFVPSVELIHDYEFFLRIIRTFFLRVLEILKDRFSNS